jgi:hypothetical protein
MKITVDHDACCGHARCHAIAAGTITPAIQEESMAGRIQGKVAFITGVARGQGRSHGLRHWPAAPSRRGLGAQVDSADPRQRLSRPVARNAR